MLGMAEPGWYPDRKRPGFVQYFDGAKWQPDWQPAPPAPGGRRHLSRQTWLIAAVAAVTASGIVVGAVEVFRWTGRRPTD